MSLQSQKFSFSLNVRVEDSSVVWPITLGQESHSQKPSYDGITATTLSPTPSEVRQSMRENSKRKINIKLEAVAASGAGWKGRQLREAGLEVTLSLLSWALV